MGSVICKWQTHGKRRTHGKVERQTGPILLPLPLVQEVKHGGLANCSLSIPEWVFKESTKWTGKTYFCKEILLMMGLSLKNIYTQSQKTFLKLPFFWRRVYANEYGVMTPDHMTLTLGPRKNPRKNVAFLLRLSVVGLKPTKPTPTEHCKVCIWAI